VRAKVRRPALLAKASEALDAVAVHEGLTHEQLVDRTVPAFGLGPDGVREEQVGDCVVRLDVDGPVLRYVNASGRVVKSAPQSIRKARLRRGPRRQPAADASLGVKVGPHVKRQRTERSPSS
jgi:hypothetical protein